MSFNIGVGLILPYDRVVPLVASYGIEEGGGRVSIVGRAAVSDQGEVDDGEAKEDPDAWGVR